MKKILLLVTLVSLVVPVTNVFTEAANAKPMEEKGKCSQQNGGKGCPSGGGGGGAPDAGSGGSPDAGSPGGGRGEGPNTQGGACGNMCHPMPPRGPFSDLPDAGTGNGGKGKGGQ